MVKLKKINLCIGGWRMIPRLALLVLVAVVNRFAVAAESYHVDPRHTFPGFEVDHLGFSVQHGRFDHTEGKVVIDSAAGTGSIDVTIDATSISTGLPELEKHLRGADFLDTERFPKIHFQSHKLIFTDGRLTGAEGDLTLHGVTKPVYLNVNRFHCGINPIALKNVCGADVTAAFKRSEFGIDKYVPVLADEVKVVIQIEGIKE